MSKPLCINCRFFGVARFGQNESVLGECHRYPPRHKSVHGAEAANFPFVNEDDWCGEYKSGETRRDQLSAHYARGTSAADISRETSEGR